MDSAFWLERWQLGQTGFHLETVHPLLERHWPRAVGQDKGPVLVPLSGKSLDLRYLNERGHPVTGIELSGIAIRQFFELLGETPKPQPLAIGRLYQTDHLNLLEADFFDLERQHLGEVAFVYDRAALIAMSPSQQGAYAEQLLRLSLPAPVFLITLDYAPNAMTGPPFPVSPERLESLFGLHYEIRCLEQSEVIDANPSLRARGLSRLTEAAWWLTPRSDE